MMTRILAAGLIYVALLSPTWAAEHWKATSSTASSVTGNVTLDANKISFAGGKSLPIARVKNFSFADGAGKQVPASLYRVTSPADPHLVRGNQLCGGPDGPVTYIVIWHVKPIMPGSVEGRAFAVYTGQNEPQPSVNGACGTFYYEPGR